MQPRNLGLLPRPDGRSSPTGSCGDSLEMTLCLRAGRVAEIGFLPYGCAATVACASILSELAQGKSLVQARAIRAEDVITALEGLPPEHHHCASLAVLALRQALRDAVTGAGAEWKRPYRRL